MYENNNFNQYKFSKNLSALLVDTRFLEKSEFNPIILRYFGDFRAQKSAELPFKSQVVVDKKSRKIICTSFSNEKKHEFKLFKKSKVRLSKNTQAITDTGYTGIIKIQSNTLLPKKKVRKNL